MIGILKRLLGLSDRDDSVTRCYHRVVDQSRLPDFYRVCGVPDTLDGRFDMLAVHAFLVMHRLKGRGISAERFSRRLFETMITDMDRTMREMGVGDMGVPRHVKAMAQGFNGRIHAYNDALAAPGDEALLVALDNNLYGTVLSPDAAMLALLAGYIRSAVTCLEEQTLDRILAGDLQFPALSLDGVS
ncbi:MAG: ubiquinol-cytochrome C chaperone family protein [Rhodospirillaceae bacterium]